MSLNPRLTDLSSTCIIPVSHRGCQVIHDALLCNTSQITRPLYITTFDYTFDDMGRLTQVEKDNAVVEEYSYDNNGNRASAIVNRTLLGNGVVFFFSFEWVGLQIYMLQA